MYNVIFIVDRILPLPNIYVQETTHTYIFIHISIIYHINTLWIRNYSISKHGKDNK